MRDRVTRLGLAGTTVAATAAVTGRTGAGRATSPNRTVGSRPMLTPRTTARASAAATRSRSSLAPARARTATAPATTAADGVARAVRARRQSAWRITNTITGLMP